MGSEMCIRDRLIEARFRHWALNALCAESYSYVTVRTGFISVGIRNCAIGVDVAESDAINLHPDILPVVTDPSAEYVGNSSILNYATPTRNPAASTTSPQ